MQWDYKCDSCGRIETRWYANNAEREERESRPIPCKPNPKKCKGMLHRQPSAPNFQVRGYCAANGYQFNGKQTVDNKGVV